MPTSDSKPRVVFMGSPEAALPVFHLLAAHPGVRLVGVVTQPDKPAGRNRRLTPCPVKAAALALGLPVATPAKAGDAEGMAALAAMAPELIVVLAYGKLLPRRVLDLPPLGCWNLHFSRLPRWRGASPVQAALLAGDPSTGITLQRMAPEMDAGDVAADSGPLEILPNETAGELMARLAQAAAQLAEEALPRLLAGNPPLQPQPPAGITHCGMISKEDGALNPVQETAEQILRRWQAMTPWPGLFGWLGGRRVVVTRLALAEAAPEQVTRWMSGGPVGTVFPDGHMVCKQGVVRLVRVKPEGKGEMELAAFFNGHPQAAGALWQHEPPGSPASPSSSSPSSP
ncbi:MAG: methionyl-tRNA formyltransferase [Deltaproteobacteria bacterium]|nr:methionyl-tRNA formyltransferase [Deltaproteobacteria bacterium]MDH4122008.1 methionyl-tRNA formyltransferase [Deltaproteobacteria bacterium]